MKIVVLRPEEVAREGCSAVGLYPLVLVKSCGKTKSQAVCWISPSSFFELVTRIYFCDALVDKSRASSTNASPLFLTASK